MTKSGKAGQIVEVAFADVFRQPLDAWRLAAAHFGVDLGNVEDVDPHAAEERAATRVVLVVVVAGDDGRRVDGEFGDTPEHVLGMIAVAEVGDQFVVDGQVRRQHEEVVDAVRQVQIADESTHQPRLAHARGERKAQRGEVALEVRDRRKLAADGLQHGRYIGDPCRAGQSR
jgi:hypothetical protein